MTAKIFLLAYENIELLQLNLNCLMIMSNATKENILIIDMGIDRDIKKWLETQNEYDYICAEGLENYARIINTAMNEFSATENVMFLNSNLICLGNCMSQLEAACTSEEKIGAAIPRYFSTVCLEISNIADALDWIADQPQKTEISQIIKITYPCVYITRKFWEEVGEMDETLLLPENIFLDYSFRGITKGWKLTSVSNAFVMEYLRQRDVYGLFLGGEVDRERLKEKWGMNYFNNFPNPNMIAEIKREKTEKFAILEVGCDCGVNLMQIGNFFPNAKLFGVEINSNAAEIASCFGEIYCGNIENYDLPFSQQSFDYILFGNVLEHLREPEKVIKYCRALLRPQGKVIASIPNLMHYSVLKALIQGNFAYQDTGLLDRTHIHFFTYNEIIRMFAKAGYEVEACSYTFASAPSEEDRQFVANIKNIGHCEAFMYLAFQYLVVANQDLKIEKENFLPKFRSDEETIRLIVEEKKSLGRFGDGEFAIAFDIPRQKFQRTDARLRDRIRQVITQTDNPNLLIGVADNYGSLERYSASARRAIEVYMTKEVRKQHMSLLSPDRVYSDAYMTRAYVLFKDAFTDAPRKRFENLKKIWEGKRIIIVEGAQTRLGVGNDLFERAESVKRILAPAENSFDRYDEILLKCEECYPMADLFLLAIGPSSGVLAYDLSKQGIQAVDVGHIDMEYEWFLAGKGMRVAVPNKYNNEVFGGDIVYSHNLPEKYYEEILADFSDQETCLESPLQLEETKEVESIMSNELVSIIMPAYNAEKYIGMSIMSAISQKHEASQLIIVDDESSDRTREIIVEYADKYPEKIKYKFREKNGGTAAALNDAIDLAEGTYICWLSADDLYTDDMVVSELGWLKENSQYDAVFSRCAYIDENSHFLSELKYQENFVKQMKSMPPIISALLHGNFWHGCSVLAKAECFRCGERFNTNYKGAQDYDFWIRMAAEYQIGYLDQVNVFSRVHSEQGSKKINCNLDEIKVFFQLLQREDILIKLFQKMEINYTFENIRPYIQSRIEKYREMDEEMSAINTELQKYYDLIKNGSVHFAK